MGGGMKTICIQIGNSDNKLTQSEWKDFCNYIHEVVTVWGCQIHFSAPSVGWADWQNAAWIVACEDRYVEPLKTDIKKLTKKFRQDSIAWLEGVTEFV
jgi:hypothetical protein